MQMTPEQVENARREVIRLMAQLGRQLNPKFDEQAFRVACGLHKGDA